MATKPSIKTGVECPCCGEKTAHLRIQKSGLYYVYDADGCGAQVFARTPQQSDAMARKCGYVADKSGAAVVPIQVKESTWLI